MSGVARPTAGEADSAPRGRRHRLSGEGRGVRSLAASLGGLAATLVLVHCGEPPTSEFVTTDASDANVTWEIIEPPMAEAAPPCKGLACNVVVCAGDHDTTISGRVVMATPPIYGAPDSVADALVYVPNGPLVPMPSGVTCDGCGPALSAPLVLHGTDVDGRFTISGAPVGSSIPLVVQKGRFRREVFLEVKPCVDNPLPDAIRLPSAQAQGELPHIAVVTSDADPIECTLRKMGLADVEFTSPSGFGRVHLYHGDGATIAGAPEASALYGSLSSMKKYDMIILPSGSVPTVGGSPGAAGERLVDYATAGGHVIVTGQSYSWFRDNSYLPPTATWTNWSANSSATPAKVDLTSPFGSRLRGWLVANTASDTEGTLLLSASGRVANSTTTYATPLIQATPSTPSLAAFMFMTPVGVSPFEQCGFGFYASYDAAAGQKGAGKTFPAECDAAPLTPQEKVVEYMLLHVPCMVPPPLQD